MPVNYYNEWDPYAAQWLRNLIDAKLIPWGVVDTRSICDVRPSDLVAFTQCHFFAGIGGWPLAARLAGWPDSRPIWTGSCPCQPFSVAGKGAGTKDARHLWPELFRLVRDCRPDVLMGEQVAAAIGKAWLDGVLTDLESIGYTGRAAVVPACAVDAPHRRDRLWFVADCDNTERRTHAEEWHERNGTDTGRKETAGRYPISRAESLADMHESFASKIGTVQRSGEFGGIGGNSQFSSMGDGDGEGSQIRFSEPGDSCAQQSAAIGTSRGGYWRDSISIVGHDGKSRRVKPGIRLLVNGISGRVAVRRTDQQTGEEIEHWYNRIGALRGFGNAIVPQVAAEIIGAYLDCEPS